VVTDGRMRDSGDEQVVCVTWRSYKDTDDGEPKSHKVFRYFVATEIDGQDYDKDEEVEK
jgi:hypothetical protein